ncbi:MAG: DUF86 domain-containing protein [Candidatus Competibacteraceae bacterium]
MDSPCVGSPAVKCIRTSAQGYYTEGLSQEDFLADKRTQQVVILNLLIIGEAAPKLLKEYDAFLAQHPEVPWRSMKSMRNRTAHGYFAIDLEVVWDTVQLAWPELWERLPAIRHAAADEDRHDPGKEPSDA